jgi:hypothetical protein
MNQQVAQKKKFLLNFHLVIMAKSLDDVNMKLS